ncbi:MAG: hypothetical protein ACKVQC_02365 [Elusimicrobiota bacterium]
MKKLIGSTLIVLTMALGSLKAGDAIAMETQSGPVYFSKPIPLKAITSGEPDSMVVFIVAGPGTSLTVQGSVGGSAALGSIDPTKIGNDAKELFVSAVEIFPDGTRLHSDPITLKKM